MLQRACAPHAGAKAPGPPAPSTPGRTPPRLTPFQSDPVTEPHRRGPPSPCQQCPFATTGQPRAENATPAPESSVSPSGAEIPGEARLPGAACPCARPSGPAKPRPSGGRHACPWFAPRRLAPHGAHTRPFTAPHCSTIHETRPRDSVTDNGPLFLQQAGTVPDAWQATYAFNGLPSFSADSKQARRPSATFRWPSPGLSVVTVWGQSLSKGIEAGQGGGCWGQCGHSRMSLCPPGPAGRARC